MFRCTNCGNEVLPPPGQPVGQLTCRTCGGTVRAVLQPTVRRAPSGVRMGTVLWVLIGAGVVVAVAIGLKSAFVPQEAQALVGRTWQSAESFAAPIYAQPVVSRRGSQVVLMMSMTDANGNPVKEVRVGGSRPSAPRITIVDANGEEVYHARLKYG